MNIILLSTLIVFSHVSHAAFTKHEKQDYFDRRFIELTHHLHNRKQKKLAVFVEQQEQDLVGCRALRKGRGSTDSLIKCMRFLKRETDLAIHSPGHKELKEDLLILCSKLSKSQITSEKFIQSKILKQLGKDWNSCTHSLWQQIYLTAYANFEADPVFVVAMIRLAESGLPVDNYWGLKIQRLLRTP
ncbi:MAG: hypothetical protein SGI74_07715 [Oligoflexia bacterium]|nr:hypothetical protein [Oligoflexia bacterium]